MTAREMQAYMVLEVPPNIWLEKHSSLTVSSSIPAQWVRVKRQEKKKGGAINPWLRASDDTRPMSL